MTQAPLRPALPLLLLPLVFAWAGIMLAVEVNAQQLFTAESHLQRIQLHPVVPFVGVGVCAAAGLARFRKTQQLSIPLITMLTLCLSFGLGNCHYRELTRQAQECQQLSGLQEMTVIEDMRMTAGSQATEVFVVDEAGKQLRLRAFWNDSALALPKGTELKVHCTATPLKHNQRWLYEKGVVGSLSLTEIEVSGYADTPWGALDSFRADNVERIAQLNEAESGALLAGVLLGYRQGLHESDAEQDFISCGLSHLIAVSGSHLAVVAALLGWFLKRLPLNRLVEVVVLLFVLSCYVMLTGLQPSAIRSAIMAAVAGCSVLVGRRGHAPSALSAAALVMLLIYPPNAYSVGFWLSVCAVMGITLFAHLIAHWVHTAAPLRSKQGPGILSNSLALTLTASSATLPLAVPVFSVLSLVGPLANLLVAPLVSAMLVLGMLALLVPGALEPLSTLLLSCALVLSEIALWIASKLSSLPFASVPLHIPLLAALVFGILSAIALYYFWPSFRARTLRTLGATAATLAFIIVFFIPLFAPPRLTVMDIGQGDAILLQEQNKTLLIDTGASESLLTRALARNGVTHIDAVVITHLDDDHAGALKRLRGMVAVEYVYFAQGLLESQDSDAFIQEAKKLVGEQGVRELTQGDTIDLGPTLSLEVLWPENPAQEGSNEESICLLLAYDQEADGRVEQQVLLTGDAEEHELDAILKKKPNLNAALIKIGHHGSKGAVSLEQLQSMASKVALISVGADNRYGHPARELLDTLESAGMQVLRTDEVGDIQCTFNGTTAELSTATRPQELH